MMSVASGQEVFTSWKDIASYLGKGVRTVQRWERDHGLPVRRPVGASQKSAVLLHREDVDAWLETRFAVRAGVVTAVRLAGDLGGLPRMKLRQNLERAEKLRATHLALTQQIAESVRRLNERCRLLNNKSQSPWHSSMQSKSGLMGDRDPGD
jgi:excisionase family DNA binding protein